MKNCYKHKNKNWILRMKFLKCKTKFKIMSYRINNKII